MMISFASIYRSFILEQSGVIEEDYPISFDMGFFKKIKSFNERIRYCEEHLQRISSGSSRIVYKIDDEKVLKLAKNVKGIAQNEEEIERSKEYLLDDVVAKVFEYDEKYLWVEMELATKLTPNKFKAITGLDWKLFQMELLNHHQRVTPGGVEHFDVSKENSEKVWDNEFAYNILDYMGNYGIPGGDLARLSSYGIVKRDGSDEIVLIDYGLSKEIAKKYYS